ncbi:MAG: hypothetical protein EZS28_027183 [Streblomastix strix]|uniref:Uncharacterized protein n=1 Tax=Streblomastix strix TaxID=222440 RepID=A0A5J4V4L3_9EUKA|nr:MAG: hypothetical protein EZS28_027183 [Streblomastix strix]
MGWPFQKLQKKGCSASPIKPADVHRAGILTRYRITRTKNRKTRYRTPRSRNRPTPEEVPPNAITAALVLLAGLSGQETSQIDFYAEEPSEEQVVEARQRARAATDLVTRRKLPKHNNPPGQPMLAFDQVLADLETKLLQQYRQLQGTLTQIVKMRLDSNSEIQFVTTNIAPDRVSASGFCRHDNNKNCRLYRRTGQETEESDCAISNRHDQEQARDNATRIGSGSSQKTDTRNPIDCIFTTTESITTVEPESIRTTESILQPAPSTVAIGIIATTIPLPILRATNAIPELTSSVPYYHTTNSIFTTGEPAVNANERTSTTKP